MLIRPSGGPGSPSPEVKGDDPGGAGGHGSATHDGIGRGDRYWYSRILPAVAVVAALYLGARYALPVLTPFVLGLVVASLMEPTVRLLTTHRVHIPRGLAALLVLLVSVAVVVVIAATVVSAILTELQQLIRLFPRYEADLAHWASSQVVVIKGYYNRLPEPVIAALDSSGGAVYSRVVSLSKALLDGLSGIPNLLTTCTLATISAYFISKDKGEIMALGVRLLPLGWTSKLGKLQTSVLSSMMSYIRAQVILMTLTSVIVIASLSLLDLRYAWLIGISAGFLDILPMVGPAAIFVPWIAALLFMSGQGLALRLLVVFGIVLVIRQLFEAKIVGESIGVHPLVTLISLYVSVSLFGLKGFVIGPIAVILGKSILVSGLVDLRPPR